MDFNANQISFLQLLHATRPLNRNQSGVAMYFHEHYGIGRISRKTIEYSTDDHEEAFRQLRNNNLPIYSGQIVSRADAAQFDISEKIFSVAPHDDSIAIKVLGNCKMDGRELWTPPGSHLIFRLEDALKIECDKVMVVENMETFRRLNEYEWIADEVGELSVLVLYRGDPKLPNKAAQNFLENKCNFVWAFFDFDPAGLAMASMLPRLEKIIYPSEQWLLEAGRSTRGRQLFADQEPSSQRTLDEASHSEVKAAWKILRKIGGGVTQEKMQFYRRKELDHHSQEKAAPLAVSG